MRIAGTVVLYNPDHLVIDNILSYAHQVEKVYAVDNSPVPYEFIVNWASSIPNVVYINSGGNQGIANALNVGARHALADGIDWLLTMDQDTVLPATYVRDLMFLISKETYTTTGIVAPRYEGVAHVSSLVVEEIMWTMTSANFLNLKAFLTVGPFMTELFIDHVDHEYCLRLREHGWKVLQANTVVLGHRPGQVMTLNVFGSKFSFSTHSPSRFYYFCRNGFYVAKRYKALFPQFAREFRKLLIKEFAKIPFQQQRRLRLNLFYRARSDFRANRFGPLNNQTR